MILRGLAGRVRAAWEGCVGRQDAVLAELGRLREHAEALRDAVARGAEERRALAAEVERCREALAATPTPGPPNNPGLLRDAVLALVAAADPRRGDPLSLRRHESQTYSQNGEDGAIAEAFRRIGTKDRFFVEIGVEDGTQNNTRLLLEQGWHGVWVEGDPAMAAAARGRFAAFVETGALAVVAEPATAENVDRVLDAAGAPAAFDFLSLDIDHNTAHVWRALRRAARVACVEYNGCLPSAAGFGVPYDPAASWDGTSWFGAGLKAIERIGAAKGMSLVGCDALGVNAFFVAAGEAAGRFREPFTAEEHHEPLRLHLVGRSGHPPSPAGRRWVTHDRRSADRADSHRPRPSPLDAAQGGPHRK